MTAGLARVYQSFVFPLPRESLLRMALPAAILISACSCTLLSRSPLLRTETAVRFLDADKGLIADPSGRLPYQKWRMSEWHDDMRHIWLVGNHDFRRSNQVELIFYFHGMHSPD